MALSESSLPSIWVDADACPKAVKSILLRASERVGIQLIFVANQALFLPPSETVSSVVVSKGFDKADAYITEHCKAGDLVVTADIPLAADVVKRHALALNPRGRLYSDDNIREILSMRDAMASLRETGLVRGGPSPLAEKDRQAFANTLDRWLTKQR